jgi:hypothetical protein
VSSSVEISAVQLNAGSVVVDDLSEGYGTYLDVYTHDLRLLNHYTPFEKGYSDMVMSASDKLMVAIFTSNSGEKKAAVFNPINGRLLNEGALNSRIDPRAVMVFENVFVAYDGNNLEAYNTSGSKLWEKSGIATPAFDIFSDERASYFFTKSDVICVEASSGTVIWTKPLNSLLTNAGVETTDRRIRPVSFTKQADEPVFVVAMMPKGSLDPNETKSNSKFIQFDKTGKIKREFTISSDKRFVNVQLIPGGFKVLTNNETLTYED